MWSQSMTNISVSQFNDAIQDKKVVLLYPQTSYRNLFLSYLLNNTTRQLLYYRLKPSDHTIEQMLSGLLDEVAESHPDFGKSTKQQLKAKDMTALAQAINDDLGAMGQDVSLYLDETDRLDLTAAYRSFFTELVATLANNVQLFINSRELTTEPWQQMVLDEDAVVIGTERRKTQLMFSVEEADKPQLEIYAFGRGHAIINGKAVESWDGALPRNLFFYFIDRNLITRDEIFNTFWPDLNTKEATNVFHVTKRKISERLSMNVLGEENYELTIYHTGFYHPGDKIARHYDVAEFEAAIDEASMTFNDEQQAELYERAVGLYRAPFLITIDMPWVHERREKLQRQLQEALIGLARIHKAADRTEQALGYFSRSLHQNPLREDIHREIMLLYQKMGYPNEAVRQYQHLETLLQDTLGVAPGSESQALLAQMQ